MKNFRPKKSFGQNFLTNPQVVEKIIVAAKLSGGELVVEVGPGFGALTHRLIQSARKVIAIEKDNDLFNFLKEQFKEAKNLELIHADALKVPPPSEPYSLVANIPYSITSPLLDHFIRDNQTNVPQRAVVLVQKEVAEKMCAEPPDMNVLALHVQTFGKPKIVTHVPRHNFKPAPKVDSAVVKIEFKNVLIPSQSLPGQTYEKYFALIHKGFSQKRKMLRAVIPAEILQKAGIDPTRRAETLSIQEWVTVSSQDLSSFL